MNDTAAEFAVVGDVEDSRLFDEASWTVSGRCGNSPIRVGDRFDFAVRFKEPESLADFENDPVEIARDPVSLTVRHIRAYERDREFLDRGMTGSLVLTGAGADKVSAGCALLAPSSSSAGNGARSQREITETARSPAVT